jgi:hypothetical protein
MLKKLLSLFATARRRPTLVIKVPPGRQGSGTLLAFDSSGRQLLRSPIQVGARADDALARRHGNPARDAMRPYGDPACGSYLLIAIDPLSGAPERLRDELGECQLLFEPSEGDAARAESAGRLLLALHGGRLGGDRRLRAAAGGLRVSNPDLQELLQVLSGTEQWCLELSEAPGLPSGALSNEPAGISADPPMPFSAEARRALERRAAPESAADDSWQHGYDDGWRSSRESDPSSGAAVLAATGTAAAQDAPAGPEATAWDRDLAAADSGSTGGAESRTAATDMPGGTGY